jgi:sugar phosphate isomerase/epimerase
LLPVINKITSFIEKHGTYISIHAPDEVTSLFQHSQYLLQGVQDYFGAFFDFAAQVKTRIITIHLGAMISYKTDSTPVINVPEEDLPVYKNVVTRNLDTLLEMANNRFVICVENEGLDNFNLSVLQPYLDKNKLALCWDLAKSWSNPITEEFFLKNLPHIKQVHLSDTRQDEKDTRRRHLVIGTGELDFIEYLNKLSEVDVQDYCIEVRPREKAKDSLEALK